MVRTWTDDETTLIATDSMQINTGINTSNPNRTGDLNLTGAAILSDNMDLNVKGDISKTDLQDTYYSESMGFGLQVSLPVGGGEEAAGQEATKTASTNNSSNPQSPAQGSPSGSTTISGSYSQEEAKRKTYATIGGLDSKLVSETKTVIGADFEGELTIDHRLLSEEGRKEIGEDFENLPENLGKNPLTPMGASILWENYTGQELSWKKGTEARFKEKGNEFATSKVGANTVGKANVIATDPNDPDYDPTRLWLIGQPITADHDYYKNKLTWQNEGGAISSANAIPGFNSMSVMHDKVTEETFLGNSGLLELSILPSIPINYYGLIGKSIRNTYEKPKNNNLTTGQP
jgi:hypothetical protein